MVSYRYAATTDIEQLKKLFLSSFNNSLSFMSNQSEVLDHIIRRIIRQKHVLIAVSRRRVVGFVHVGRDFGFRFHVFFTLIRFAHRVRVSRLLDVLSGWKGILGRLPKKRTLVNYIAVDPNFRKKGIGVHLLAEVQKRWKKRILLEVDKRNKSAIRFYRKLGFKRKGESIALRRPYLLMESPKNISC